MPATGGARRRHSTMHLDCSLPECPSSLAAGHRTAGQGRGVVKIQTAGNDITPEAPGLSLGHGPAAWRRLPRRDNGAVAHDGTVAPVAAVWCFRNFVVLRWSASHLRCGRRSSRPPWPQCRPTRPPRRICSALGCGWPALSAAVETRTSGGCLYTRTDPGLLFGAGASPTSSGLRRQVDLDFGRRLVALVTDHDNQNAEDHGKDCQEVAPTASLAEGIARE
jgi:hypothetical protein